MTTKQPFFEPLLPLYKPRLLCNLRTFIPYLCVSTSDLCYKAANLHVQVRVCACILVRFRFACFSIFFFKLHIIAAVQIFFAHKKLYVFNHVGKEFFFFFPIFKCLRTAAPGTRTCNLPGPDAMDQTSHACNVILQYAGHIRGDQSQGVMM